MHMHMVLHCSTLNMLGRPPLHDEWKYKVFRHVRSKHIGNMLQQAMHVVCSVNAAPHDAGTFPMLALCSRCVIWVISAGFAAIGCDTYEHDFYGKYK